MSRRTLAPRVAHRRPPTDRSSRPVRAQRVDHDPLTLLRAVAQQLDADDAWPAAAFARRLHDDLASGQPARVMGLLGRLQLTVAPAHYELAPIDEDEEETR